LEQVAFVKISRRVKAVLVDGVVLGLFFFATVGVVKLLGIENSDYEAMLIFTVAASFEPFFLAFTGGSVGHHLVGLKVRRAEYDKKINLFQAYARFFTRAIFGFASLVTILTTKKYQAVHDLLVGSIVVYKSLAGVPSSIFCPKGHRMINDM
jgi:uncharacterized RDD family membrane protein YckC